MKYLNSLVVFLNSISKIKPVIFPVHPRTRNNMIESGIINKIVYNVILTEPIGYIDFQCLSKNAKLIITDSGGIQEESTYNGVQCITVRNNTERPSTVEIGTNHLTGTNLSVVENTALDIINGNEKCGNIPELWDGKAAERICSIIVNSIIN